MSVKFIKSQKLFESVWLKGIKYHGQFMMISVIRCDSDIESKFGISIGKSLGNAVKRNRIERRIRNILLQTTKEHMGLSLIVYLRKNASNVAFKDLKQDFISLFRSINIV